MNRKNILGTMLAFAAMLACAACLPSCSAEHDTDEIYRYGELTDVTVKVSTRADIQTPQDAPEFTRQTIRMYAFDNKGTLLNHYYGTSSETEAILKLPAGKITFVLIANEEAAGELKLNNKEVVTLDEKTSLETLRQITFSTLPEPVLQTDTPDTQPDIDETKNTWTGAILPMTSIHTQDVSANAVVNITLLRSVAKLNLHFAKVGVTTDQLFLGRGLYLYNVPQYGYLFPGASNEYTGSYNNLETDDGENSDSHLHQKGGKVILKSGYPKEPANPADDPQYETNILGTHINEIKVFNNTPSGDTRELYQDMPARPIYLFANPGNVSASGNLPTNPSAAESKGYYLKILAHMHRGVTPGRENPGHEGQVYYVSLPPVEANQKLDLYSKIAVDGYISITPRWSIADWTSGGGDVTFE